jgi:phosphoserine aminotransferase
MEQRIHNFNAGPAALPLPVLATAQEELLNFKGSGMSVMEISHRSKWFDGILEDAVVRMKRLLGAGDNYQVLFLQGGASTQFAMAPMNLLPDGQAADYVNTGTWAKKAIQEAQILGKKANVPATSQDRNFAYIPKNVSYTPGAAYVHLTSNNTIEGTQYNGFPDTGDAPIVTDMSSDMLCRPVDISKCGLVYAGAQKNLGPAGVCIAVLRKDMLERVPKTIPTMFRYTTHAEKNSLYNTPPCWSIYIVGLVLKWLEETVGGLDKMEAQNRAKAELLYKAIDKTGFYKGTADKEDRSWMNVTFRLGSEDLEKKFVAEAEKAGLGGLKGHRSVGGCRASIYNATGLDAVEALVSFMNDFEKNNG